MTKIDCHAEMTEFHAEEVTLSQAQQTEMRGRRDAGRTRLRTGLARDGHPLPAEEHSQGSYAMRTMTQDAQLDYDIDDGAYFEGDDLKNDSGAPLTPYGARDRVCAALKQDGRLKHDAIIKNNCVRQPYPEGYHIDIPVYRIIRSKSAAGSDVVEYEHASGDEWIGSDGRAVTRWFNDIVGELSAGQPDGSQMRRVVKLTKKFARSRMSWKVQTTTGICMTRLVVECLAAAADRDDDALRDTWKAIRNRLDCSLRIEHPVMEGKLLADEGDPKVRFFRDCLVEALGDLEVLDASDCNQKKARTAWDRVFNTSFFSDQPSDEDSGSAKKSDTPFVVSSPGVAQREDGGRRFG